MHAGISKDFETSNPNLNIFDLIFQLCNCYYFMQIRIFKRK